MDKTPVPKSLAAARLLPWKPGRSAEAFIDGDLEIRFTPRPTDGPRTSHRRDEVYVVDAGSGFYRVEDKLTAVGPGDMCFAAAHAPHGFESFTDDFALWIIFYGPVK
ncbi:MAG: cupin domain-containing protein [Chloroflexi bacterium]|nr:cupin domain-containing protein [Chloroflexota bacterium]